MLDTSGKMIGVDKVASTSESSYFVFIIPVSLVRDFFTDRRIT